MSSSDNRPTASSAAAGAAESKDSSEIQRLAPVLRRLAEIEALVLHRRGARLEITSFGVLTGVDGADEADVARVVPIRTTIVFPPQVMELAESDADGWTQALESSKVRLTPVVEAANRLRGVPDGSVLVPIPAGLELERSNRAVAPVEVPGVSFFSAVRDVVEGRDGREAEEMRPERRMARAFQDVFPPLQGVRVIVGPTSPVRRGRAESRGSARTRSRSRSRSRSHSQPHATAAQAAGWPGAGAGAGAAAAVSSRGSSEAGAEVDFVAEDAEHVVPFAEARASGAAVRGDADERRVVRARETELLARQLRFLSGARAETGQSVRSAPPAGRGWAASAGPSAGAGAGVPFSSSSSSAAAAAPASGAGRAAAVRSAADLGFSGESCAAFGDAAPVMDASSGLCFQALSDAIPFANGADEDALVKKPAHSVYSKLVGAWEKITVGDAMRRTFSGPQYDCNIAEFSFAASPLWLASAVLTAGERLPAMFLGGSPSDLLSASSAHTPRPGIFRSLPMAIPDLVPGTRMAFAARLSSLSPSARQSLVFLSDSAGWDLAWWTRIIPLSGTGQFAMVDDDFEALERPDLAHALSRRRLNAGGSQLPAERAWNNIRSTEELRNFVSAVCNVLAALNINGSVLFLLLDGAGLVLSAARRRDIAAARTALRVFWGSFVRRLPDALGEVTRRAPDLQSARSRAHQAARDLRDAVVKAALMEVGTPFFQAGSPAADGAPRAGGSSQRRAGDRASRRPADPRDGREHRRDDADRRGGKGKLADGARGGGEGAGRGGDGPGAGGAAGSAGGRQ